MSGVRNADEFLRRFRTAHRNYDEHFLGLVRDVRARTSDSPTGLVPPAIEGALEAHLREYFVNHLLDALNWRLGTTPEQGLPDVVPEAPVASLSEGTTRYLDYLGMDGGDTPLLVVETKRPSAALPRARRSTATNIVETPRSLICEGLDGRDLGRDWNAWLQTLADYVRSIQQGFGEAPRRAVITNGEWMVIFLAPVNAFGEGEAADAEKVLVYESRADQEERYTELFGSLEYRSVLGEAPALTEAQVAFYVRPEAVTNAMHGVRLLYIEDPGFYELSPAIKVMPVVFLRSRWDAWLTVDSGVERTLPDKPKDLVEHLDDVREISTSLLNRLNERLGIKLCSTALIDHYAEEESFKALPGVKEVLYSEHKRCTQYVLATGDNTHYLLPEPTVPECPYHEWAHSNAEGQGATRGPIATRAIDPRSFFMSGEKHHCAHKQVAVTKESRITAANSERCGRRSGGFEQAFCEIWPFEEHLCCRTCAFESVCEKAEVFQLPCRRPDTNGAN